MVIYILIMASGRIANESFCQLSIRHSRIRVYFTITITRSKKSVYLNPFQCVSSPIALGNDHACVIIFHNMCVPLRQRSVRLHAVLGPEL